MTSERLFSVVIPTHNRAAVLPEAVASVMAQSFEDFEIIVVDNGSTDETADVVRSMADPRITYLPMLLQGVCAARNQGARRATGRWVTFLDSDDIARPGWLAAFSEMTERRPEPGLVSCGLLRVDDRQPEAEGTHLRPAGHPCIGAVRHLLLAGAFAVRREPFLRAGGYEEAIAYGEHSELRLRLLPWLHQNGLAVESIEEPLVVWRRSRVAGAGGRHSVAARLAAAELMLSRHGELLRATSPRNLANSYAISGICHARFGDWRTARERLFEAIVAYPKRTRNLLRFVMTLVPPLGRLIWKRIPDR